MLELGRQEAPWLDVEYFILPLPIRVVDSIDQSTLPVYLCSLCIYRSPDQAIHDIQLGLIFILFDFGTFHNSKICQRIIKHEQNKFQYGFWEAKHRKLKTEIACMHACMQTYNHIRIRYAHTYFRHTYIHTYMHASHHIISHHIVTSHPTAPHRITSHHIASHYITLHTYMHT